MCVILQVRMYTREFEGCAVKCVDKHVDLIPNVLKNMNEELNKSMYQHAGFYV